MKKILLLITIISITYFFSVGQSDCKNLPKTFSNYTEAITKIKSTKFKFKESVNTTKSTWIRSISYFSCNGSTGYLIMKTDKKEYVHTGVPYYVWINFKKASSFGRYYDYYIKHKYRLYISN